MSLPRLNAAQVDRLQNYAHDLEALAEDLRGRAVDFRAIKDTGILTTVQSLTERADNIARIVQEAAK